MGTRVANAKASAKSSSSSQPAQRDVIQTLIADLEARRAIGLSRYGRRLVPGNGRAALQDALEEALDLAAYIRQEMLERERLEDDNDRAAEEIKRLRAQVVRLTEVGSDLSAQLRMARFIQEQKRFSAAVSTTDDDQR